MRLPDKWREILFNQAQSLGLRGSIFQNPMDIDASMVSQEMDEVIQMRNEAVTKHDQYYESLRNILVEMGRTGVQ